MKRINFFYVALLVALVSLALIYILGYSAQITADNFKIISTARGLIITLCSFLFYTYFIKKHNQYLVINNLEETKLSSKFTIVISTFVLILVLDMLYFHFKPFLSIANADAMATSFSINGSSVHWNKLYRLASLMLLSFPKTFVGLCIGYSIAIFAGRNDYKKLKAIKNYSLNIPDGFSPYDR